MNDVDLNLLHAFHAIFVERSVTRAAKRLSIGQPAMSDALRRLRALFDDPLFVRAAGEMRPTPKADAIAIQIAPILKGIGAMLDTQIAFDPAETTKIFSIGSTDYTTLVILPALMRLVRDTAPYADLRIVAYDKDAVGGMLDRGEVDLALGVFPTPPPNAVKTPLFKEEFVGLACAGHSAILDGVITPGDFIRYPHALASVRRDERGAIDTVLHGLAMKRRIALVLPYMLLLAHVLPMTDLLAVLPKRAAESILSKDLQIFKLPMETNAWSVDMLWNPLTRTDRATAWLRTLMTQAALLARR